MHIKYEAVVFKTTVWETQCRINLYFHNKMMGVLRPLQTMRVGYIAIVRVSQNRSQS